MYKHIYRLDQDCIHDFNLETAENENSTFFQNVSDAIIIYDNMPACSLDKVVTVDYQILFERNHVAEKASGRKLLAEQIDLRIKVQPEETLSDDQSVEEGDQTAQASDQKSDAMGFEFSHTTKRSTQFRATTPRSSGSKVSLRSMRCCSSRIVFSALSVTSVPNVQRASTRPSSNHHYRQLQNSGNAIWIGLDTVSCGTMQAKKEQKSTYDNRAQKNVGRAINSCEERYQ